MFSNDPRDYYIQVAMGRVPGALAWSQSGYNLDVGVVEEDIWTPGGTYVWPAITGVQMEVVSTGAGAANDAAAGTGVQQVRIGYLDTSYNEQFEVVTMAGAVAVPTVATNMIRVNSFRAYRCGGTNPKAAAGTILLRGVGGGATYSAIAVGYTRSRNSMYTVPAGKVLYMTSVLFSTGSSSAGRALRFTVRATYDTTGSGRVLGPNFFQAYTEEQIQDREVYVALEEPSRFPATVDLKVSALSDAAGGVCATITRGFLATLGQV